MSLRRLLQEIRYPSRMRFVVAMALAAPVLAVVACNGLLGIEDRPLRPDEDASVAPPDAAPFDASVSDSPASLDAPTDAVPDGASTRDPCPSDAGARMVFAGAVCIDSTEVTRAQYAAFLASKPTVASAPPECAFKTSFVPSAEWPPPAGTEARPVIYVDWCDATAYCKWAGKRVCGSRQGGPLQTTQGNSTTSQWYYACSNDGLRGFPYGPTYQPKACNGIDVEAGAPMPVASLASCDAGFGGLFDMAGNVQEWFDGCDKVDGGAGANDSCLLGGGSFNLANVGCNTVFVGPRSLTFFDLGIRCCGL